ncbi:hypothetical protein BmR1_04g07900 [Babesia microti strain RI]|uniref:Uncharacterized protein n=1 Tax=Babesia microti (strain RI) TaxID=1133968 RepID=I7ISN7_BABMR|nr:hypothetical protein BmR1_04g07900 [Babesia microti strain RI]CCF75766.1 hypothetical protein BmR1_04g07900 [Babesia microti strain RI]|eukprot:XP_012650174.1 hypothetical protein BmR1_04g07900 [Babesia microti strain RI]
MTDDPVMSTSLRVLEFPELSGRHSLLHRSLIIGDSIDLDLEDPIPKITVGGALTFYGKESSLGSSQLIVKITDTGASLFGFADKKYIFTSTMQS